MPKFCENCGSEINGSTMFCENCGNYVNAINNPQIIAPGFSERVNDPEILAAVKKNKKAAKIFALILVPIPIIGMIIYSLVSDKMELGQAAMYGGIISAVFLLFAVYSFIKNRAANTYEAVVTKQKTRERSERDDNGSSFYTEYITYAKTTDGKKKKIVETDRGVVAAYHYLNEGDRFKYHPQFSFPYELYDKSKAPYIACVSCGTHNSVYDERCKKCGIPLLK